jgi:transketolase
MSFPINVDAYKPLALDPTSTELTSEQLAQLKENIQTVRDTLVFYTAIAGVKGLAGHTGGAYDIVPEVLIADGFMKGAGKVYPVYFDEAGHRVAIQYAMAAFNGEMPWEKLYHYREANHGLFGHPEIMRDMGVKFASGRLGHMWPFINGVARAHPDQSVFLFGSDGSQQEGNDAEAARFAVAQNLNVKLVVDDNNVTIAGYPEEYLPGYSVAKTLEGHGLAVIECDGEDPAALYGAMQQSLAVDGPVAVIAKRVMAPGIPGIEGSNSGHDVVNKKSALAYLEGRGLGDAVAYLNDITVEKTAVSLRGSADTWTSNRSEFGQIVSSILGDMTKEERVDKVLVIDSDLEGSTGIKAIHEQYPEVYIAGGIMERGNFSAAAGFSFDGDRQGIFATFSAFIEMILSEATMARLNESNVICHFSHAGVDDIADNTCHFGINVFFGHNGFGETNTNRLYFAADGLQLDQVVRTVFNDKGIRFIFTTRSKVPHILDDQGKPFFDKANGYTFTPGKDDIIREGTAGYVVSYGETLYRALDAVEAARAEGIDVGLINKATLNIVDEDAMAQAGGSPFVVVAEGQNRNTGLGCRYGTWLLERGHTPRLTSLGVDKDGCGGTTEQMAFQGLDSASILAAIKALHGA